MRSSNMNIRIDPEVKANAEAIFDALGITTTDGINIFLKRVIAEGGIPFDVKVKIPNATTLEAMKEAEEMVNNGKAKKYNDMNKLFEDLYND